jgi:hypothetical protein
MTDNREEITQPAGHELFSPSIPPGNFSVNPIFSMLSPVKIYE